MPTYHCIQSYYEHGIGDVRIVFVLSDTYNGLFASSGVMTTSIFDVRSSKKDLELQAGVSAQDELQINCNEYLIANQDDESAFELFYSARDASVRVFVAVFINQNLNDLQCTSDNADMIGVLNPDMKAKALMWSADNYATDVNPSREWQATAISFGDSVLNRFSPKDLVQGVRSATNSIIVPAISESWRNSNVSDRLGWYHYTPSGNGVERKGVYSELVNLGTALRAMADNMEVGLSNTGVSNYSIVFDDFDFDYEFLPSLPNNPNGGSRFENDSSARILLRELIYLTGDDWESDVAKGAGSLITTDALKHDIPNKRKLKLFSSTIDEQLYVHWRMFAPANQEEEKLSFYSAGNFLEMLYSIAYSFGMLIETYNSNATTLHVRFVSRQNLRKWRVYPIGAVNDDLNLKVENIKDKGYYALGSNYTVDARDAYALDLTTRRRTASYQKQSTKQSGTFVPLAVARSLAVVDSYVSVPPGFNTFISDSECIPHNGVVIDYRNNQWNVLIKASGISTALYMYSSNLPARMNPPANGKYITPVASIMAKVDGKQLRFDSIAGYSNYMNSRAGFYYETERTIDVPFLCAFSRSESGSFPSWKELALGCEVVYSGVSYLVLGIERDYSNYSTKLRLQATSRFVFEELGNVVDDSGGGSQLPNPIGLNTASQHSGISSIYTASGDIVAGDIVMLTGSGLVSRATANVDECYETIAGVALHNAEDGMRVSVALPDSLISSSRYEFETMERLYVRTADIPDLNITSELLTSVNAVAGENTIVEIGVSTGANSFMLSTPTYIIREELL
jgi:hypothetical protein